MRLKELQQHWNRWGEIDPLWAIATDPTKRNHGWDPKEFFFTGEVEIYQILEYVASLNLAVRPGRALDFGCGAGRLCKALAKRFDEVNGVDIAPSMLRLAEQYNEHGPRCKFFLNDRDDLRLFPDNHFDFIYTNIVLQHIRPAHSKRYLSEFLRVLAPGGHMVFQLPSHLLDAQGAPAKPRLPWGVRHMVRTVRSVLRKARTTVGPEAEPIMEMHGVPRLEVEQLIRDGGGKVIDVQEFQVAGPQWMSYRYCVGK